MASLRRQITTDATVDQVWDAIRDIGALHTRLVPGFVVDTQLAPGERLVTFANGMVVRELIVAIDEEARRLVWTTEVPQLAHYNASAQALANPDGGTTVVWVADLLPDEGASFVAPLMDAGMAAMKACLDRAGR